MLAEHQWEQDLPNPIEFKQSAAREAELLEQYAHLVKRAAAHLRSLIGPVIGQEDLLQVGLIGLLTSIRRYGREADEQFESYAFKRIRGAMLDEFRQADWRPRDLRRDAHKMRDGVRELTRKLGRTPTDQEICQQLELSPEKYLELEYVLQAEAMESLNLLLEQQVEPSQPDKAVSQIDLRLSLKKAMKALPERNKLLLHLYYSLEMNMKEIAMILKLTESRVCQLHKQSIEKLNRMLAHD